MIIDDLDQAVKYYGQHPHFQKAFEYLLNNDLENVAPGKYTIIEDHVFAIVAAEVKFHVAVAVPYAPESTCEIVFLKICLYGWTVDLVLYETILTPACKSESFAYEILWVGSQQPFIS